MVKPLKTKASKRCKDKDIWDKIEKAQKDPEFIRAAYEFIRLTTGHSS